MNHDEHTANGNKRTILIVICAVLLVLCLLALPWCCTLGTTVDSLSVPNPTKLTPIQVDPTVIVVPGANQRQGRTQDASADSNEFSIQKGLGNTNCLEQITQVTIGTEEASKRLTGYNETDKRNTSHPGQLNPASPSKTDKQEEPVSSPINLPVSTEPDSQKELDSTSISPDIPDDTVTQEKSDSRPYDQYNPSVSEKPNVYPKSAPSNPAIEPNAVIQEEPPASPIPQHNRGSGKDCLILWIIILAVLLICYIIARVKSKRGDLVITANIFDKILIILSPILFFVAWCIGFDHELIPLQIILLVLSGLMLMGSILFSIFANLGNIFHIIISILAKIFIFVFTNFLLLLLIVIVVFSFMRAVTSHNDTDGTYVMKYDHFLDQWVGYRID